MRATDEPAIRSIAIVGGGSVGLSAALAFARAFAGLRVTVVETPFTVIVWVMVVLAPGS